MIQYILESIAFQLVFLIIYDAFLKRETFFQWNRAYLIGTYLLSMVLPWIKIEALKATVPEQYYIYPEFLWQGSDALVIGAATEKSGISLSWESGILYGGMVLAALYFGYKLYQIQTLRNNGSIQYYPNFTQIVVKNSEMAFSFFRSIFLGDKVLERDHKGIIQHELVHIEQRHSWDLLFFELMRIAGWFNPLVYVYQGRVSELHEFIADAQVAKTHKKEQYELLLSQVFQTENISFINQFFKTSLIKKRIVMLQKVKSKQLWKLKYLFLIPVIGAMLLYSSCQIESEQLSPETIVVDDIANLNDADEARLFNMLIDRSELTEDWQLIVKDEHTTITFSDAPEGSGISGPSGQLIKAKMHIESKILDEDFSPFSDAQKSLMDNAVPFGIIEEVPVFPGCEDAADKRACFNENMQRHISKNFNYPQKAQEMGIQGRVAVMFTISESGSVENIKMRGPDKLLEDEVERIISRLPKMEPGKNKGKAVKVPYSIPITFKLAQAGFNPNSRDANYVKMQNEQISELSDDVQIAYQDAVPFAEVENVPVFPGCEEADDPRACFQTSIQKHISKHFKYPQDAQERGIQGRVSIIFLVDSNGDITSIAKRGPDKTLEDEAARIISKLPRMAPGRHQGKNVDVPFSIPITFRLQKQPVGFQFIKEEGKIFDDRQRKQEKKYIELLKERQTLLVNGDESNPIIKNLDEQLKALKTNMNKHSN